MAAVMSSTAFYDLGDILLKNQANNANNNVIQQRANTSPVVFQQNGTLQQQKLLRLNNELLQQISHAPVVRRVSTPVNGTRNPSTGNLSITTATLVNSVATLLPVLENIQNQNLHRKLDRSQSEPAKIIPVPQNINSSRYKTELCRPYEESGTCKYGDKCQFAHGAHELRSLARHPKYKTELCRTFHTIGFCPYGPRCHFVHNAEEVRANVPQFQQMPRRPTPLNIAPFGGSVSGTPSPSSSLSQSPTTSYCSFFSECDNSSNPCDSISNPSPPPNQNNSFAYGPVMRSNSNSPRQSPEPINGNETRLPVFNLMGLGLSLEELLA